VEARAAINTWVRVWRRVAKLPIDAGVAEHKVRLATTRW
jgi:hypothetical protein